MSELEHRQRQDFTGKENWNGPLFEGRVVEHCSWIVAGAYVRVLE